MSSRCLPITKAIRERRRKEAELRQAAYDTLSTQQKIDRLPPEPFSQKQRTKLLARLAEESNPKRTKAEVKNAETEGQTGE
jgi:hypothetical protein